MLRHTLAGLVLGLGLLPLGGCPPEDFSHLVGPTQQDIDGIVSDTALTPQEQRVALEDLGLSDSTINLLLRSERLGNQYGGDLRTAYTKVTSDRLTDLTPDEVQVYGDEASALDTEDTLDVTLSDSEAQAIVDFFRNVGLSSRAALEAYLDTPDATIPDGIPDDVLGPLFVDFDPDRLLPVLP